MDGSFRGVIGRPLERPVECFRVRLPTVSPYARLFPFSSRYFLGEHAGKLGGEGGRGRGRD